MKPILFATAASMLAASAADAQIFRRDEGPARERSAGEGRIAVGGSLSTNGLGAEVQGRVTDFLVVRGGGYYLGLSLDETYDDVAYDGDIDFATGGVFADYHPFSNGWLVTAGGYFGQRELDATAVPTTSVEIGDTTFTPEEIGTLLLDTDLGGEAPFVGFGFNNAFTAQSRFSFQTTLGVMFTGSPEVSLDQQGGLAATDPTLQALVDEELVREEANLQDDLDDFEYYPVLSFGLNYRF